MIPEAITRAPLNPGAEWTHARTKMNDDPICLPLPNFVHHGQSKGAAQPSRVKTETPCMHPVEPETSAGA